MPRLTIPNWFPPVVEKEVLGKQASTDRQTATIIGYNQPLPIVLGTAQVGGRIVALKYSGSSWYASVIWCAGPVLDIGQIFANGAPLPISGTISVATTLGSTSQGVNSTLSSVISGYADRNIWDTPYGQVPACYSMIKWSEADFPTLPQFTVEISGYNNTSRTTFGYSDYPAYNIATLIEDGSIGLGEPFNVASFEALHVANTAFVGTSSDPRRKLGIVLDQKLTTLEWLEILAGYAGAWIYKQGGIWYARPDRPPSAADAVLTAHNYLKDSFELDLSDPRRDRQPTVMEVAYTDQTTTLHQERIARHELPGVSVGAVPEIVQRVRMPGIPSYSQAMREAKERLAKLQRQKYARYLSFDDGLARTPGDVVQLTNPMGPSNEWFRVNGPPRMIRKGRVQVECVAFDPSDYDDSAEATPSWGEADKFMGPG